MRERPPIARRRWLAAGLASAALILAAAEQARAGVLDASWTAPTTNTDGSPLTDLASYKVYYGVATGPCPGGVFFQVISPTASPAPGTTVSFRLKGLTSGSPYFVSVTAVDLSGSESACSPTASATAQVDYSVTPTGTLSFGNVNIGSFIDQTLTVQSTRGGTVAGTVTTSAPFSIVSGSPFSLGGAGATQTVTVRFTPVLGATATTNLTVIADGDSVTRLVTGIGVDITQPTVTITSPTSNPTYSTGTSPLTIGGTASDALGVTQVTWANNRGGSGAATGTTSWSASGIVLQTGSNVLTVTARDLAGNTATDTLTVTFSDTTAPVVTITSPTSNPTYSTTTSLLTLAGTASDAVGVTQVTWANNRGGSGTATGTTSWSASGIVLQSGSNVLTVTARDAAGNTASDTLTVTFTGFIFTDDPVSAQGGVIKAVYLTELRTAINSLRTARGLLAYSWTDSTLTTGSTQVKAVHLTELRTALNQAYQAAVRTTPTYTDLSVVAGTTVIKAVHINELRSAVRAL